MKKQRWAALLMSCLLLGTMSGCSFMEREYSSVTPHSSSYYESEDRSVLRAESYQDLVNDLLMLLGDSAGSGTIWLYSDDEELDAEAAMEQACQEVQRDTPLGAYALDYLTYTTEETNRTYTEIQVAIGYRRTPEQIGGMIHATSVSALSRLLEDALTAGRRELVVQLGYFENQSQEVLDIVAQVEASHITGPEIQAPWQVNFYPDSTNAGIIEILMVAD